MRPFTGENPGTMTWAESKNVLKSRKEVRVATSSGFYVVFSQRSIEGA